MKEMNDLVRTFFNKDSLQICSIAEVRQLVKQYPYCTPLQLLLTQKLKLENSSLYEDQLQRSFLYFSNPLWLAHLLQDEPTPREEVKEKPSPVHVPESFITVPPIETVEAISNEPEHDESAGSDTEEETSLLPEDANFKIPGLKIETIDPETATLTFEPYHTIDYFASQGIKAKEEGLPVDRFSIQLKSFTEWLKAMKRLPANEVDHPANPQAEEKVEQMAEHSIEKREVLTETMAEVWVKQGSPEKASEIYQKLSLLDPTKSSYFAAKIEQLKKQD